MLTDCLRARICLSPYSCLSCDVGTLPNQSFSNHTPTAAHESGLRDYGGQLSWLRGQRLSACTCQGEDHPGPDVTVGRGAPEIDLTEQQVDWRGIGSTSQSIQASQCPLLPLLYSRDRACSYITDKTVCSNGRWVPVVERDSSHDDFRSEQNFPKCGVPQFLSLVFSLADLGCPPADTFQGATFQESASVSKLAFSKSMSDRCDRSMRF